MPKGFCYAIRASHALVVWLTLIVGQTSAQAQEGPNRYTSVASADGPILRFTDVDVVLSGASQRPETGWQRISANPLWTITDLKVPSGHVSQLWSRVRFDRAALGQEPLAIHTLDNREQFTLYLNGRELFRNFSHPGDLVQGWYRPYLIPVPKGALRPGVNEISLRVTSDFNLAAGNVEIGPNQPMQARHSWLNLWRIQAPSAMNNAALVLAGLALLVGFVRRNEKGWLLLAGSGVFWYLANYHFYAMPLLPSDPQTSSNLTIALTYFATIASLGFCLTFFGVRQWAMIFLAESALGLVLGTALLLGITGPTPFNLANISLAAGTVIVSTWRTARSRSFEQWLMLFTLAALILGGVHDIGRIRFVNWWDGLGFFIQPYNGLIFCLGALLSFGKRSLLAFSELEMVNKSLALRVDEARAELAASEAKRRGLEVNRAVERERERIMREVHDGIGANIVAALVVAERQNHPPNTIQTLKRALSDLKITVDSLEPFGGDVVALLANFRHRLAPDLEGAGIVCRWYADQCRPLDWLDAPRALHLLRLLQEAFGNILAHSGADKIAFECREEDFDGCPGVCITVVDNGCGFDRTTSQPTGHGIGNMHSRASAIAGMLRLESQARLGTKLTLWLPNRL